MDNKTLKSTGASLSSSLEVTIKNSSSGSGKKDFLSSGELSYHIERCALNNRESQKKIYSSFYRYAMVICMRYSNNREDVAEIINDGFLKIFKEIHRFKPAYIDVPSSFKGWVRKIMMYTAIDHSRSNHKYRLTTDLDNSTIEVPTKHEDSLERISYKEIKRWILKLTPGYRNVFNLYIIQGYSHEEISGQLGISIGASKSNLARAKKQLQKILLQQNKTVSLSIAQ